MDTVTKSGRSQASGPDAAIFAEFIYDHRDVITDGFGQAGGGNTDESGLVFFDDIFDALLEVRPAAVNGMLFPERRRSNVDGFAKVADDIAPHVGGAPLGSMEKSQGAFNALKGQSRSQRGAQLARIGRGDIEAVVTFRGFGRVFVECFLMVSCLAATQRARVSLPFLGLGRSAPGEPPDGTRHVR